ncbi:hypothetical protein DPMN_186819 [Dreissena polymorpha]|uniref:Uncharacterized protein n=1 Tax=Dreissena polymorpha TaxID=45954 RepID=A0A9D4DNZ3_DREPO|nr:hypothetical protein DPMN_186819 [Dreissena polymorpha]
MYLAWKKETNNLKLLRSRPNSMVSFDQDHGAHRQTVKWYLQIECSKHQSK